MRKFTPIAAAVALVSVLSAVPAHADSFFWAINQFTTIQKLNGDTGAVVSSFAAPNLAGGRAASIAVVGNTGYYTILDDANVYKVDMTTHLFTGIAFSTGVASLQNGITNDANGHLWFAGGNSAPIREFDTAGTLLSSHAFPNAAAAYRDGSVVFGNFVVANRGDQIGPYDKYNLTGGNLALTVNQLSFITTVAGGSNGIAYNGTNFYTSDEQAHKVSKWTSAGVFVSVANLDPGSRYENWTFASQDIIPDAPEPSTYAMMFAGLALVGYAVKRKSRAA